MDLIFHRLVQRDLRIVLRYYEEEAGVELADRFFDELGRLVREIEQNPQKFHLINDEIRRANLERFPYHLLFKCTGEVIRVLVLRHDKQRPEFGLGQE